MKFCFSITSFLATIAAFGGYAAVANAQSDIPQTAIAAGGFDTLVAALTAADLVDALSDPNGPFTVFAPNDDAFSALPDGLLDCLLRDKHKGVLTSILLYHVASGKVMSSQLSNGQEIPTLLEGSEVTVDLSGNGVKINDSTVIAADIEATNGVIHVINQVLVPEEIDVAKFLDTCALDDIPTTAINADDFNTLVAALTAADLVGAISEPEGPFTVFAPTDAAFAKLPEGLVTCLLEPRNKPYLTDVLLYHVASDQVLSSDLSDGQKIPTLGGSDLTVDITMSGGVKINDSNVIKADVLTSNGVIHIIDAVLVPDGKLDDMVCESKPPPPAEDCSYLGVWRSVGQKLTGPTHTCLCTAHGWDNCVPNHNKRKTIQQFVLDSNEFTTLEAAVVQAGLVGVLDGDGPFTLFAPNDDAFADVPSEVLNFLLDDANKEALGQVLKYHIVGGTGIESEDIPEGTLNVDTVAGGNDKISATKKCFSTLDVQAGKPNCDRYSLELDDGSDVIVTDVHASNGVIHIINKVLVPPSLRSAVASLLD